MRVEIRPFSRSKVPSIPILACVGRLDRRIETAKVPLLAGEGVEIAADFEDEQDALVAEFALGGILVPVGGDIDCPQVTDETVRIDVMGLSLPPATGGKFLQVFQGRAVAADRGHRRPEDVLVVVEKLLPQFGNCQRREREYRWRRGGQLGIELGRERFGELFVQAGTASDLPIAVEIVDPPGPW
jgi:hypothetical protein